jgi:hypothetical protein
MIVGILERDAGEVTVCGRPHTVDSVTGKALIGYVPQEPAVYPDLSARENLRFFARLYGLPRDAVKRRVDEVLDVIGLADRAKDLVKEYSGGMKRASTSGSACCTGPACSCSTSPPPGWTRRAATRSWRAWNASPARASACSTPPTTWRRPNGSATASASSTRGGCGPRAPGASSSPCSASTTG